MRCAQNKTYLSLWNAATCRLSSVAQALACVWNAATCRLSSVAQALACVWNAATCRLSSVAQALACVWNAATCRLSSVAQALACIWNAEICRLSSVAQALACVWNAEICRLSSVAQALACVWNAEICRLSSVAQALACVWNAATCRLSSVAQALACVWNAATCRLSSVAQALACVSKTTQTQAKACATKLKQLVAALQTQAKACATKQKRLVAALQTQAKACATILKQLVAAFQTQAKACATKQKQLVAALQTQAKACATKQKRLVAAFQTQAKACATKQKQFVAAFQTQAKACATKQKRLVAALQNMLCFFSLLLWSHLACAATVDEIFDNKDNSYYIKKTYYTEENIQQGHEFFEMNCAVCHGSEADGAGPRADVMQDAKPRMLTNLDWINTRDDLRLLRSIKYGVPGTAMTPWGDFTSSSQRMQLVIFIRSLTAKRELQDQLATALYNTFETQASTIEMARIEESRALQAAQASYDQAQQTHRELLDKARDNPALTQEILKQYQLELTALELLQQKEKSDSVFAQLKELVKKESYLYKDLSIRILSTPNTDVIFNDFITLVTLSGSHFSIVDGHLKIKEAQDTKQVEELQHKILDFFNRQINALQEKKKRLESKIQTPGIDPNVITVNNEIKDYTKLKNAFIGTTSQAQRLNEQQHALLNENTRE